MRDEIEEKKVNPEKIEGVLESGVKPPEIEKETETLKEEVEKNAPEVEKRIKDVKEQEKTDREILINSGADESNMKEVEDGQGVIDNKSEAAKDGYAGDIKALQNNTIETEAIGRCSSCGAETQEGDKFCTMCGNKLLEEKENGQDKNKTDEGIKEVSKETTAKEMEKIIEKVEAEIEFLKITALTPEEQLKSIDEQLKVLAPFLENQKNYNILLKVRALENKLKGRKSALGFGNNTGESAVNSKEKINKTPEELFKESEKKFLDAYNSLKEFNPALPNYFKRNVDGLKEILDQLEQLKKNGIIDEESLNFAREAAAKNIENLSKIIADKPNVDIYFVNPGSDREKHEKINIDAYSKLIKERNIKADQIKDQMDKIDKEIISLISEIDISLFSDEWQSAKSFIEIAEKTKNIKEQQAYLAVAMYVLDSMEKGMKDDGIKKALKVKQI